MQEGAEHRSGSSSGSGAVASGSEPTSLDMLESEVARVKHVVAALELEDEEQLTLHHEQMDALRLIVTSLSTELQEMRGEIEGIEDELAAGI